MEKIVDYMVAYDIGSIRLTEKVCQLLKEDWQPIGGVSFVKYDMGNYEQIYAAQAMVKYGQA